MSFSVARVFYFCFAAFLSLAMLFGSEWGVEGRLAISTALFFALFYHAADRLKEIGPALLLYFLIVLGSLVLKTLMLKLGVAGIHTDSVLLARDEMSGFLWEHVDAVFILMNCLLVGYILAGGNARRVVSRQAIKQVVGPAAAGIAAFLTLLLALGALLTAVMLVGFEDGLSAKRFGGLASGPQGRFGNEAYWFFKLALLSKVASYVFLARYINSGTKFSLILLIAGFSVQLAIALFFSHRASMMLFFVDLVLYCYCMGYKPNRHQVIAIIVFSSVCLFAVSSLRSSGAAAKSLVDHLFGGRYFLDVEKNALLFDYLTLGGEVLLPGGKGIAGFLSGYVSMGRVIGENVFNSATSGVPPGLVGELFSAGGFMGAALGMIFLGFFLKKITQVAFGTEKSDLVIFLYVLLVSRLVIIGFNTSMGAAIYQFGFDAVTLVCLALVGVLLARLTPGTWIKAFCRVY